MIHVVFNRADEDILQKVIALDDSLQGAVTVIQDDYAVGPLQQIYIGEGIEARKAWWRDVLAGGDYEGRVDSGEVDDYKTVAALVGGLRRNPEETVWIWAAQNKHDVCGYYWLLHYMKEFQGRVFILYLNNLPFINEKGMIFYPQWLSEIPAREFLKAKKLARPVTLSEFEVDPDEWSKICAESDGVRLLEGGKKLTQAGYDHYDAELLKYITGDWQKASRIIHQFLSKTANATGDAYLLWRLKNMAEEERIDAQGERRNMKDFELKQKAKESGTVPES